MSQQQLLEATEKAVSRTTLWLLNNFLLYNPSFVLKCFILCLLDSCFCFQVGSPDMFDDHQKLIELRKQEKELEVFD